MLNPTLDLKIDFILDGNSAAKYTYFNRFFGRIFFCFAFIDYYSVAPRAKNNISPGTSCDVNVASVPKQLITFFFVNNVTFLRTLSMTKLKRSHDKALPCLNPRLISKGSERSIISLTRLQKLVNVSLHSLISIAGLSNTDIVAMIRFLMGLWKAAL